MQIARNVTDSSAEILRDKRYFILDRDTKYPDEFRKALIPEGIHLMRSTPKSPNLNAFAEWFARSMRGECLSRVNFMGKASLRHASSHDMAHHHGECNHQGLENRLLRPADVERGASACVKRRERLGGMLGYYHRQAAGRVPTQLRDNLG